MHFAILLCIATPAFAQTDAPLVGRPKDFSGLVGQYSISTSATPTQVRVEEPITLSVRITAFDPKSQPPERLRLHLFPDDFSKDFYVEEADSNRPWEFVYRLRPKHADVKLVPSLKLVYYHPGRQKYQAAYSEAIELTVLPQRTTSAKKPADLPAFFFNLPTAEELVAPAPTSLATNVELIAFIFVTPPTLCLVCYLVWRRLNPDTARRTTSSTSRIGSRIIGELRTPGLGIESVSRLFAEYLRNRTGLQVETPTPSDVDQHLRRVGAPRNLRQKCAGFFDHCAAAMFAPLSHPAADLREAAIQSIRELEAEPCLRRS